MKAATAAQQRANRQLHDLFKDYYINVSIDSRHLSSHERQIIQKATTEGTPNSLRFRCVVAEAVNDVLQLGLALDGHTYWLNEKVKAQFGKNGEGVPYLTVGLVNAETNVRYRLSWFGDNVPHSLKELAVAHDLGEDHDGKVVPLLLGTAEVHVVGQRHGGKPRGDKRPNHDTNKEGQPYPRPPRRNHRRICRADL